MVLLGRPARRAALAILSGVLQKRRSLDGGLDQLAGLPTRDAGFARALVSQTLRHMGALDAVLRNIDASGTVLNVSYGTRMGHDLQFYRDIPIQPTGYGQALSILCLAEGLHHLDAQEAAA